jgi:hypothetical protein
MQLQQFDSPGEQLLRSGIAPRHVRRYLRELRDHYDDAVHDQLKNGVSRAAAEAAAAGRLGEPERLVQSALARPELRSTVARYPRLMFGMIPALVWSVVLVLTLLVFIEFAELAISTIGYPRMWSMTFAYGAIVFVARVLPLILTFGMLVVAFRQRLPSRGPIVGAAIVAILAGTVDIAFWRAASVAASSLGISSSLLPLLFDSPVTGPVRPMLLAQGLIRAVLMLALAIVPFMCWSRRQKVQPR